MVSKEEKIKSETMKHHLILKVITKFMVGVIVLFGLYVQFHGDYLAGAALQTTGDDMVTIIFQDEWQQRL